MAGAAGGHSISRLIEVGCLAHAVQQLRAADGSRTLSPIERSTLLAELLVLTGLPFEAKKHAEAVLSSPAADAEQKLRCQTVLAQLLLDGGDARSSARILRTVVEAATQQKLWRTRCWVELHLLTAISEYESADDIRAFLRDLRRHVNQLGDIRTSIALHLFVAQAESRRGVLDSSVEHVKVARALLDGYPNYWLEGLAAIDALCLAYMRSDQDSARTEAERALRAAFEAGAEKVRLAAIANVGTIALAAGDLRLAERRFREALKLSKISRRWKAAILDGLGQLELAKGNTAGAMHLLDEVNELQIDKLSYQNLWTRLTRVKVHEATGQWEAAEREACETLIDALHVGDQELIMRLRLLRAEAAAMHGDLPTAAREIYAAGTGHPDPSLELVAEWNRVVGTTLAAAGDTPAARAALARGVRVLDAIGHARAARELAGRADALPADDPSAPGEAPDAAARPDLTLSAAAALVDQAARPDLLAGELAALLRTVGCTRAFAVVAQGPGRARQVVSAHGWSHAEALAALDLQPPLPQLPLGEWRDQQWTLVVDVPQTVSAQSAFVAVRALLTGARRVDGARREARERSALWPLDAIDDNTHGVFASEAMQEVVRTIRRVAPTSATVLVTGETGTGKDVLARLVHEYSPRASQPFVPFNCTAVPREMLDSQLFGHRRGAFTGAQEQSPGVIRGAQGGTLFLDEIGELGLDQQVKLLRFLESSEIHPIGESHPIQVDVRVIAATNRDLEALVREGRFREDLFYRLNVVRLRVPPLRERREEIPLIVEHFLTRFGVEFKKGQLTASAETMEYLLLHPWPGNVRQLANELRRAVVMAEPDGVIMPEHLQPETLAMRRTRPATSRDPLPTEFVVRLDQPLAAATEHLERALIQHAMTLAHGHMDQAAQFLGISRKGLYLKRQRLGLGPPPPPPGDPADPAGPAPAPPES